MTGQNCQICGTIDAPATCEPCRAEARHAAAEQQRAALADGRRAEAAGQRVIYIHGRPYADPGNEPQERPLPEV